MISNSILVQGLILKTLFFSNFASNTIIVKRYQVPAKKKIDYREISLPINITYRDFKNLLLDAFKPPVKTTILGMLLKPYGRVLLARELECCHKISFEDRKDLLKNDMLVIYFDDYLAKDVLGL